jgi:hypothetical protein
MAAPDKDLISLDALLYVDTAGTTITPGPGNLLATVGDVELDFKKAEAKTNKRGCPYVLVKGTLIELSLKFTIRNNPADTNLQKIITAFFARTPLAFLALDNGSGEGPDADFEVMELKRSEKLEEGQGLDFTIKPTWAGRNPTWKAASYA